MQTFICLSKSPALPRFILVLKTIVDDCDLVLIMVVFAKKSHYLPPLVSHWSLTFIIKNLKLRFPSLKLSPRFIRTNILYKINEVTQILVHSSPASGLLQSYSPEQLLFHSSRGCSRPKITLTTIIRSPSVEHNELVV